MSEIASFVDGLTDFWLWLIGAGVLMIAELAMPGVFLIWLGVAALATALVVAAVPLGWQAQLVVFALAALVAVVVGRLIARSRRDTDRPFLNRRAEELVGRAFVLREPIEGGVGQIRVDDTIWRVAGPDCPAGVRVVVVAAEGASLTVRPEDQPAP